MPLNASLLLFSLLGCNTLSSDFVLSLGPARPNTGQDLIARVEGAPTNGLRFHWMVDGVEQSDLITQRVGAARTTKNERWTVNVWYKNKEVGSASVQIINSPPSVNSHLLGDNPFVTTDVISLVFETYDADSDPVDVQIEWTLTGQNPITGPLLPANATRRGQLWVARLTASDGDESISQRHELHIVNSAPTIQRLALEPTSPNTTTDLMLLVDASDADGDPLSYKIEWTINGQRVSSQLSLDHGLFVKGDQIIASAIASDDELSSSVAFLQSTVIDAPPSTPIVSLAPAQAAAPLQCVLAQPSIDPDEEPIEYQVHWTVDDLPFSDSITSELPGDTVPASATQPGQRWLCQIDASSGGVTIPGESDTQLITYDAISRLQERYWPDPTDVFTQGVITGISPLGLWLQDPSAAIRGGIFIFMSFTDGWQDLLHVGQTVTVQGSYTEQLLSDWTRSLSQIVSDAQRVQPSGDALATPSPQLIGLDSWNDASLEPYEGMLVRIENVSVSDPAPQVGAFQVEGIIQIGQEMYNTGAFQADFGMAPQLNDHFSTISGVLHYTGYWTIEVRDSRDLEGFTPAP